MIFPTRYFINTFVASQAFNVVQFLHYSSLYSSRRNMMLNIMHSMLCYNDTNNFQYNLPSIPLCTALEEMMLNIMHSILCYNDIDNCQYNLPSIPLCTALEDMMLNAEDDTSSTSSTTPSITDSGSGSRDQVHTCQSFVSDLN